MKHLQRLILACRSCYLRKGVWIRARFASSKHPKPGWLVCPRRIQAATPRRLRRAAGLAFASEQQNRTLGDQGQKEILGQSEVSDWLPEWCLRKMCIFACTVQQLLIPEDGPCEHATTNICSLLHRLPSAPSTCETGKPFSSLFFLFLHWFFSDPTFSLLLLFNNMTYFLLLQPFLIIPSFTSFSHLPFSFLVDSCL